MYNSGAKGLNLQVLISYTRNKLKNKRITSDRHECKTKVETDHVGDSIIFIYTYPFSQRKQRLPT